MTTTEEQPVVEAPAPAKSRIGTIVRWAARVTSLPVLAMALVSLVPTLTNFAVASRDDRMIAAGLGGACVGYLLGWNWPGIGGLLALLGVGLIFTQADSSLSGDPFSIAFALQAVLFLLSSVLNLQPRSGTGTGLMLAKRAGIGALAFCAVAGVALIYRGPGPTPLAKDDERYAGAWDNNAGFRIEITRQGAATVTEDKAAKVETCNTPVRPGETKMFNVTIQSGERLELTGNALANSKIYHIDQHPVRNGKQFTMVLNGSDPYQRGRGMVLVKKDVPK